MKVHKVYAFEPTPFTRSTTPHYVDLEQAWRNLIERLDVFCEKLGLEIEPSKFKGVPAGQSQDYFVWKRRDVGEAREVTLPPGAARALNDLYYSFCRRLQEEYEAGVQEGTHLLRRMADGELTIQDIDNL